MGVSVHLDVQWDAIDPSVWTVAYDEALTLLRAHPSQILGYAWRPVLGREIPMYTKDVEQTEKNGRCICVVGDRRSMRFAESFRLSRSHPSQSKVHRSSTSRDLALDEPEQRSGARVFGAKTQGEPYHDAIVAVGILIEAHFPGAALLWGDINEAGARASKQWAEVVLGRALPMPVLYDAPTLVQRLSKQWQGEALLRAFVRRFRGEMSRGLAHAFSTIEAGAVEAYLRSSIASTSNQDDDFEEPVVAQVQGFLLATGNVARLLATVRDVIAAEKIAEVIAHAGVLLPAELRTRAARQRDVPLMLRPDVSSLGSLVGAMYLDRDWSGPAVDDVALENALSCVYPGRGVELLQLIRQETQKMAEMVASSCDTIERGLSFQAKLDPFQDVGELAALENTNALEPYTRRRLAAFAYALRAAARESHDQTRAELLLDPAKMRFLCVEMARKGPSLTEFAWDWILKEEDPMLLDMLLDLLCCQPGSDEVSRLRRAIMENRTLCVEMQRMMHDEAAMTEGKALIEEAERARATRAT
jgi:hypothetical protein